MRVSSVAMMTSRSDLAAWQRSATCWMSGLPAMRASGLPGKRVEANRAGMTPMILSRACIENPLRGRAQVVQDDSIAKLLGKLPLHGRAVTGAHQQTFFHP